MKKFLIIGHARHGKDSLANIWRDNFEFSFKSSSKSAVEIFIFDLLHKKYGYKTTEECYEDRINKREEWKQLILDYNKEDKSRLTKEILNLNDCYVGMRALDEFKSSRDLFNLVIWVDASKRHGEDPTMEIPIDEADIIIDNNYSEELFITKALNLGKILFGKNEL